MVGLTHMRDQVQFVSITTDPARDTSEVLKAYGPAHGLDAANWTFLTTRPGEPEDATRKLAEQFGHKSTREQDGEFAHGVVTHVIDREGKPRGNFYGLDFDPANLVTFVNALVNDVHKPGEDEDQPAAVPGSPAQANAPPLLPFVATALALALAWSIGATTFFAVRRRRRNMASTRGREARHGIDDSGDSVG
jgi:hypothetical protein